MKQMSFFCVLFLSLLSFKSFSALDNTTPVNKPVFDLIPINEGGCSFDDFKRVVCIPEEGVFTAFKIQISRANTKLALVSVFSSEVTRFNPLIDVEPTAQVDLENVYWVVETKDQSTKVTRAVIYRETYMSDEVQHEKYSVVRLDQLRPCVVAELLSERLGPEVDLLKSASRVSRNTENLSCL